MITERDVIKAQKGNEKAFVRLIKQCEPTLYRAAKSILHQDADCADALQETILKSFHSLHTLRQPRYFQTWLVRILINECYKILRDRKRVVPLHTAKEPSSQSGAQVRLEVHEALDQLSSEDRMMVLFFYFDGFSIRELADLFQLNEGTVKTRLRRARLKLAECLGEENEKGKDGGNYV